MAAIESRRIAAHLNNNTLFQFPVNNFRLAGSPTIANQLCGEGEKLHAIRKNAEAKFLEKVGMIKPRGQQVDFSGIFVTLDIVFPMA